MINKPTIELLRPCSDRLKNYLNHYSDFKGDIVEFLELENITPQDKIWVAVRIMPRLLVETFAIDCAFVVATHAAYATDAYAAAAADADAAAADAYAAAADAAYAAADAADTIYSAAYAYAYAAAYAAATYAADTTYSAAYAYAAAADTTYSAAYAYAAAADAVRENQIDTLIMILEGEM